VDVYFGTGIFTGAADDQSDRIGAHTSKLPSKQFLLPFFVPSCLRGER
jgi:hypothetical protein